MLKTCAENHENLIKIRDDRTYLVELVKKCVRTYVRTYTLAVYQNSRYAAFQTWK